jgi:hypothetical protein
MQDSNHLCSISNRFPTPPVHVMLSDEDKNELLAKKIEDRIKDLQLSRQQFAYMMQVQPSSVTKWLSGKHNFTLQTIYEIERVLGLPLMNLSTGQRKISTTYNFHITPGDLPFTNAGTLLSHLRQTDPTQVIILSGAQLVSSPMKSFFLNDIQSEENTPIYEYINFVKPNKKQ